MMTKNKLSVIDVYFTYFILSILLKLNISHCFYYVSQSMKMLIVCRHTTDFRNDVLVLSSN